MLRGGITLCTWQGHCYKVDCVTLETRQQRGRHLEMILMLVRVDRSPNSGDWEDGIRQGLLFSFDTNRCVFLWLLEHGCWHWSRHQDIYSLSGHGLRCKLLEILLGEVGERGGTENHSRLKMTDYAETAPRRRRKVNKKLADFLHFCI